MLKELGVRQESLFYWIWRMNNTHVLVPKENYPVGFNSDEDYSAFTVAELGEMLPPSIKQKSENCYSGKDYYIYLEMDKHIDQRPRGYRFRLRYRPEFNPEMEGWHNDEISDDTEAEARAAMLIYLLENKLITIELA